MGEDDNDDAAQRLFYSFKPLMMSPAHEFELTPGGLNWRISGAEGLIPYKQIRRVRLSFRPVNLQTYRFLTEIWAEGAPRLRFASVSWRSMLEQARQDGPYRAFVTALHEKLAAEGSAARFEHGKPPLLYWPGLAIFLGLALVLAFITGRSMREGAGTTALVITAIFIVLLWQVGLMFYRNRPGIYRPTDIPRQVLPRG